MIVNVEFFDENPLENVITSLNYKVDKTIFFGYKNAIEENKKCVENFLKKYCDVQFVTFCPVDEFDFADVIDKITETVNKEIEDGNEVFFDLTGGESLPLVAFGIMSNELMAPMHKYDVSSNQMYEYSYEGGILFSEIAEPRPIKLNLEGYISLYGGVVNKNMHKQFKDVLCDEDIQDITKMWNLFKLYELKWTQYSGILRQSKPDDNGNVCVPEKDSLFYHFLRECEKEGFLKHLRQSKGHYNFTYKNDTIKQYLCDAGSILEMHVYLQTMRDDTVDDYKVGIHIDWDGVIHNKSGEDVINEIDIMYIQNNLPTFISCKIGSVDQDDLYELETIANRFGGKYAKKILVIAKEMSDGHLLRAKELGIEVRME